MSVHRQSPRTRPFSTVTDTHGARESAHHCAVNSLSPMASYASLIVPGHVAHRAITPACFYLCALRSFSPPRSRSDRPMSHATCCRYVFLFMRISQMNPLIGGSQYVDSEEERRHANARVNPDAPLHLPASVTRRRHACCRVQESALPAPCAPNHSQEEVKREKW